MKLFFKHFWIVLLFVQANVVEAKNYYLDPATGIMTNDGSISHPWGSMEEVFLAGKTFQGGDTLYLLDGYHGKPVVNGQNSDFVTIQNLPGHKPVVSRLIIGQTSTAAKWRVSGLIIGAKYADTFDRNSLVYIHAGSTDILLSNLLIYTDDDISDWTIDDWNQKVSDGLIIAGDHCSVKNSTIQNVGNGIQLEGVYNTAQNNLIANFSADGIRVLGDDGLVEYNTIRDNYVIDTNHDDGIQSWSYENGVGKGVVKRGVIRGNTIINYTNPTRSFLGPMQGIMGSDGMFDQWVIENNVVVVDHWHGITLIGATNCKIINNTVLDPFFGTTYPNHPDANYRGPLGPAWIRVANHKDGSASSQNLIRNNISNQVLLDAPSIGTMDNNLELSGDDGSDYSVNFMDYLNSDYHLKANSTAIDSGSDLEAPSTDANENIRPVGMGYDIGAYEYGATRPEGILSTSQWHTSSVENYSDIFYVEFDLQPNNSLMDGVTGLLSGIATAYSDLSCLVRFNTSGVIDVYDLTGYRYDYQMNYFAGDEFHVKMVVDVPNQKYDVLISKNGGSEVEIAAGYGFRRATEVFNAWAVKRESGSHLVSNLTFYSNTLGVSSPLTETIKVYSTVIRNGVLSVGFPKSSIGKEFNLCLISVDGRVIGNRKVIVQYSKNVISFTERLKHQPGIYILTIRGGGSFESFKLLVQE